MWLRRPPPNPALGALLERDVSEWRRAAPDSGLVAELRRLRSLDKAALEAELGVALACSGNPYEQDAAILFHLIGLHGCAATRAAVNEMIGAAPVNKKENTKA